jgi:sugar phosphate isomerase/epimerase
MKNDFPFRLGCTSYIYPADILPNVTRLAPLVNDIELILFEWPESSLAHNQATIRELARLAKEHALTYTIHLPLHFSLYQASPTQATHYQTVITDIIEQTAPLAPYAYILHLEGLPPAATDEDVREWQTAARTVCTGLVTAPRVSASLTASPVGIAAPTAATTAFNKICVENLDYPLNWHIDLVREFGFSLCMDIGHLWKHQPTDWLATVKEYFPLIRVIHLHGEKQHRDHISLKKSDRERLKKLIDEILPHYQHILTLELFNEKDLLESIELLQELWHI